MTQNTVCRLFPRTRYLFSLHYFEAKWIKYNTQRRFLTTVLYQTTEISGKTSIPPEIQPKQKPYAHGYTFSVLAVTCYGCQKRWFQLSARRHVAFPPLVWAILKFAAKAGAIFTGRGLRMWLKTQPKDVKRKYYKFLLAKLIGVITISGAFGTAYYVKHQQEAPITHRKRFISLTPEQYLKVANFESENYMEKFRENLLPATHPYYDAVVNIARRLVAANQDFPGMSSHKWTISVIKGDERNAFVLPNGYVFVFTGLIDFVDNQDQLAMVVGHEMAHALMLHAAEQLSYTQLLDYLVILVMAAIWFVMPSDGIAVVTQWFSNKIMDLTVHMPYSRQLEKEADIVGLQLASKACYDVREGSVFWQKMNIAARVQNDNFPEWASTHPSHEKRVETFDFLLPKALEQRVKSHCPALPECDPRDKINQLRFNVDNLQRAQQARVNLCQVQRIEHRQSFFSGLTTRQAAEDWDKQIGETEGDINKDFQVISTKSDDIEVTEMPDDKVFDRHTKVDALERNGNDTLSIDYRKNGNGLSVARKNETDMDIKFKSLTEGSIAKGSAQINKIDGENTVAKGNRYDYGSKH